MSSSSDVSISITVIDKDGTKSVIQLQGALDGLGNTPGPKKAAEDVDKIGQHALTSLDNVRLLRDDLGIRIPRSMEKAIASSQLLSSAIGGIGSVLLGFGAAEIFVRMGTAIYEAEQKFVSLSAVADDFQKQLLKTKDEDFINTHSIETATARLLEARNAAQALQQIAQESRDNVFKDIGSMPMADAPGLGAMSVFNDIFGARKMAEEGAKKQQEANALKPKDIADQHALNLGAIELQHATDARLKGEAAISAEMQKQVQINAENQRYSVQLDRLHGNTTPDNAGQHEQEQKDAIATAEATAKRIDLAQKEHDEVIRLQNEATNARLQGNALYAAQEQQAIDGIVRKYREGEISKQTMTAETAATRAKFDGEALKRQDELDARLRKAQVDAAAAGLTGIARIQAETAAAIQALDEEERKMVGGGTETAAQRQDYAGLRATASASGNQKMIESERQFYEELDQLAQSYETTSLEGYARIDDEAQKHIQSIQEHYNRTYGQMNQDDAEAVAAAVATSQKIAEAYADADRQRQRLHRETMESLKKEEELAGRDSLPPWLAAEMAIVDTYQDRVRKAKQALQQQQIDQQEYNQTIVAASAVANAQMVKQMQQTRDQLASQLQSFFQHPEQYIEKRAMDTAFQYAANGLLQLFQKDHNNPAMGGLAWLFGMNGQASTSIDPGTFGKSLFGMGGTGIGSMAQVSTTFTAAGTTMSTAASTFLTAVQMFQSSVGQAGLAPGGLGFGLSGATGSQGFGSFGNLGGASSMGTASSSDALASLGVSGGGSLPDFSTTLGGTSTSFSGTLDGFGSTASSIGQQASASSASAGGKYLGAAGGAVTGAIGVYNAFENSNPLTGALSGAELGASIGSVIPGVGTAIGAVVGAVGGLLAGIFGDQGKGKAQDYDKNTIQPGLTNELYKYNTGQLGYDQAVKDLDQMMTTAKQQTSSWGRGASSWYRSHIFGEITAAEQKLGTEEKNGRDLVAMSAAQFHTGGMIGGFGDFATSSTEGFIHAKAGEFVVRDGAAAGNTALLHAINSGLSVTPSAAGGSRMVPASSAGGSPISIVAWDGKSVDTWLRNGGAMKLRAASNMANGQYGGIGQL
jgi:hypothetical protein